MDLLPVLFIFTSLICGIHAALQRQPVNFRTVFFGGTILYGAPLFLGYTFFVTSYTGGVRYYESSITWEIYLIFFSCQIVFLLSTIFGSKRSTRLNQTHQPPFIRSWELSINIALFCFYLLLFLSMGKAFFIPIKQERAQFTPVWYHFCSILTVSSFIFFVLFRQSAKKRCLLLPSLFLVNDLCWGYRSTFLLGLLSVACAHFTHSSPCTSWKKKLILYCTAVIVVLSAMAYKPVFFSISVGNGLSSIDAMTFTRDAIQGIEGFAITGTLNEIIKSGISTNAEYILISLYKYFPFFENLSGIHRMTFNDIFQPKLFPEVNWGLASTTFGELFASFGWAGIFFHLLFILYILSIPIPQHPYFKLLYFFIMPYVVFYFHRNDFLFFLGTMRLFIIASAAVCIFYTLLRCSKKTNFHNAHAHFS